MAFFSRRKTNIGQHLRRHYRMPPLISMAALSIVAEKNSHEEK